MSISKERYQSESQTPLRRSKFQLQTIYCVETFTLAYSKNNGNVRDTYDNLIGKMWEAVNNQNTKAGSEVEYAIRRLLEDRQGTENKMLVNAKSKQNIGKESPQKTIGHVKHKSSLEYNKLSADQEEQIKKQFQYLYDKKLKIALADSEFYIKRLNEDYATYKTLHELYKAKMTKYYDTKIHLLKQQIEYDNQNWINRFYIRDKYLKSYGYALRFQYEKQKYLIYYKAKSEIKYFKYLYDRNKDDTVQILQNKHSQEVRKLQFDRYQQLENILNNHKKEMTELAYSHCKELERVRKESEILLVALRSERKTEENMHETTKNELHQLKEKLYHELYDVRKENEKMYEKIKKLEKDKKQLEATIEQQKYQIEQIKMTSQNDMDKLRHFFYEREKYAREAMKYKISEILYKQLEKAEQLDGSIKILEQKHTEQVELYSTQMEQIKNCYEERPSRQEDLQMIRQLEYKLWKKESDLELVCQELKWHRLELYNKYETYNKIFTNGYNVSINELKFPSYKNRTTTKEFKFRRVAKSLLTQKEHKNSSGKLLQTNFKIL